jgi:hypothetical protein
MIVSLGTLRTVDWLDGTTATTTNTPAAAAETMLADGHRLPGVAPTHHCMGWQQWDGKAVISSGGLTDTAAM